MRAELETLRKLRSFRVSNLKFKKSTKTKICNLNQEKISIKIFEEIQTNYDYNTMAKMLKNKLIKEEPRFKPDQIDLLVESMLMNQGGCPV